MSNNSQMALQYHRETSHSVQSLRRNRWKLDWFNQPIPYKIYSSLEPLPLPVDFTSFPTSRTEASSCPYAIASPGLTFAGEQIPDYALHSGATGLTFFDDEVTAFFSPHAAGKSLMFLIALGQPLKKRR